MFEDWDNFYLLIGGAGGALIGLLFVVVTLTNGRSGEGAARGQKLYMTPNVVHFGAVVVVSAMAMTPKLVPTAQAVIAGGCGLVGLIYGIWVSFNLFRGHKETQPHWSDPWWYGALPAVAYAALVAAAFAIAACQHRFATYGMAADLIALLLIGIRNAWDLVTWLAPRTEK